MCSSPGPTGFPGTPTGWTSGFSSFSTWCCFSSCTLFPDWFADIPGSWLLQ